MGGACLEALAAHAQKQLPHLKAQQLADTMWAFAKFKHSPDATLLRGCEAHATRIARTFIPSDVARCCLLLQVTSWIMRSACEALIYIS